MHGEIKEKNGRYFEKSRHPNKKLPHQPHLQRSVNL
nr:MAG TPA: hypothetical protein [Caudoviricetes sp.]